MINILVLLGIAIFIMTIVLFKRSDKILHNLRLLQKQFLFKHPVTQSLQPINFAEDFLAIKSYLGFLYFMPLNDIASELKLLSDSNRENFNNALKRWEDVELRELEVFNEKNMDDAPFAPSEELKKALRSWSEELYNSNVISRWEELFKEVMLELLQGKIKIKEAQEKLKCISSFKLSPFKNADSEIEELYDEWSNNWKSSKWRGRLDLLRSQEDAEKDLRNEIRKMEILNQ